MQNDELTPVTSVLELLRGQLATHHDRLRILDDFRVETAGAKGGGGRLRALEAAVEHLDKHLEENRRTLNSLDKRTEGLALKLGAVITIATAVATLAANLFLGG